MEETVESQNDLRQFLTEYIAEKHWALREYCRDTDRKLGAGNGIPVSTLSFILRGTGRISLEVINKIAEYHGLPVNKVLEMANYYSADGGTPGAALADLLALRKDVQSVLERLDRVILALK